MPQRDPVGRSLEQRKLLCRFIDVCNAIDYAHFRGVLRRDIKPDSTIVGKHGETLVIDWRLVEATGKSERGACERTLLPSSAGRSGTRPGSALGTPADMSPEQARENSTAWVPGVMCTAWAPSSDCLFTVKPPF